MTTAVAITLTGSGNIIVGEVDYLPPQGDTGPQGLTGARGPAGLHAVETEFHRGVGDVIDVVNFTLSDGSVAVYNVVRDGDGKPLSLALVE